MHQKIIKNDLLPLLTLALPLILTGALQSSLGFFENIFLARLGEDVLAAGALVGWLFATMIVVVFGTFSAVNILIAHKYGEKNFADIPLILRDGFFLAIFLFIPTFVLFWNASSLFYLFGQSPKLVGLADLYLHALAYGLFPKFILFVLFEFVMGLGHSRVIMMVTLLSIPLYIFMSFVLIFGKFGFPALGIAGAGWGMTYSDWIITSICSVLIFLSPTYRPYLFSMFTLKPPFFIKELLHVGVPIGTMYCLELGFFLAVSLVMGTISIEMLAANQIAMQYLGPLMGMVFSLAQAVTVRMGHQLGANEVGQAKITAYLGIFLSGAFMVIVALAYWLIPHWLIAVDFNLHDPRFFETIRLATEFLFIAAFFQIIEATRIAFFGALRALKDTRFTLIASTIGFWGVSLPVGYLLAITLHFGGSGLWWGMVAGSCISVIIHEYRFRIRIKRYVQHR